MIVKIKTNDDADAKNYQYSIEVGDNQLTIDVYLNEGKEEVMVWRHVGFASDNFEPQFVCGTITPDQELK